MYKLLFLTLITLDLIYDLVMRYLSMKQKDKPLPENVRDVYDEQEYRRWRVYSSERARVSVVEKIFDWVILVLLFATPVFSAVYKALPGGEIAKSVLLLLCYSVLLTVCSIPFEWWRMMRIEVRYGFNRSSKETFWSDQIKDFLVNTVLNILLYLFVYAMFKRFGVKFFWFVYAGIAVFVIVFSMLATTFQRLYNKFTPLEEGELRDQLTELFKASGYELENIYVMDASRRTTKVNAFCSGLGKFKKIVLYDNLVNNYTTDEITAVFAHELGHYKRRDTLKNTLWTLLLMAAVTAILAWFALTPEISLEYGFDSLSVVFGVIAMQSVVLSPVLSLLSIPHAAMARAFEYRADANAADLGYGEALISSLKKLSRDNFSDLNPHPVIVALEYDHPTLDQRISAIRDGKKYAGGTHAL